MPKSRSFRFHIPVFLAPAVLIYSAFMIYPLINSLWLSLSNKGPTGQPHFVGFENYLTLFSQEKWAKPFWNALCNNALFFVIHMLVQNPVGLLLAALLGTPNQGSLDLSDHYFYSHHFVCGDHRVCLEVDFEPGIGEFREAFCKWSG